MATKRWIFHDPVAAETWTVPINPVEMGSPFAEKNIASRVSTALHGKVILFEGAAPPATWEFGGKILNSDHYAELLKWSKKGNRITITDHFGRVIECYIQKFTPTPQRSPKLYFKHDYTMTVLVTKVPTAPTKTSY